MVGGPYPEAEATVIRVDYVDDTHAVVVTDSVPSHPMYNHCERREGGWVFTMDHN